MSHRREAKVGSVELLRYQFLQQIFNERLETAEAEAEEAEEAGAAEATSEKARDSLRSRFRRRSRRRRVVGGRARRRGRGGLLRLAQGILRARR